MDGLRLRYRACENLGMSTSNTSAGNGALDGGYLS